MSDNAPKADDGARTVHAQEAFKFSDLFAYKFGNQSVGSQKIYRLKLMEPDGMSTAGGRQARQSMILVPEDGEGGSIVCGWLDVVQRAAELRGYSFINQQFEARHGLRVPLKSEEYDKLIDDVEGFLKLQKFEYSVAQHAATRAPSRVVETSEQNALGSVIGLVILAILIGIGIGYLAFGGN